MALTLLFLLGLALIVAPIALPIFETQIGAAATLAMLGVGGALVLSVGVLWIFKKLYVKTRADRAFVRTGRGFKIIKDGGAIVIPFLHEIVWVSLQTFEVEIDRRNKEALLTADKLRVDVLAEFYVKVMADDEKIASASRSFGEQMNAEGIRRIVEKKLVSALRTVAAQKTLEELNSDRAAFMEEVTRICAQELTHNGLTLESAAISALDQTSSEHLNPNNVFDAQGLRTIAEITEQNKTMTNQLQRTGEQERKRQDVETRKKMLLLSQDNAAAEASQVSEVKQIEASRAREAREKQIEATRAIEHAEIEKERSIEVAKKAQEQAIEVAVQQKQEAVEVAVRAKESAIALAEKDRAEKQSQLAEAEKHRQERTEAIQTVTVVAAAERQKQQQIIAAEAEAQRLYIADEKGADAAAYKIERDATARKTAADADAEATRKKAEADRDAEIARAKAREANEMVPVKVKAAEVEIEQRRFNEVVKPELEARDKFGQSQQDFELAQLFITEQAKVETERARASVEVYRKIEVQAFSTLEQVGDIQAKVLRGHGLAGMVNGFKDNLDGDTASVAIEAIKSVVDALRNPKKPGDSETAARAASVIPANGDVRPPAPTIRPQPPAPPRSSGQ